MSDKLIVGWEEYNETVEKLAIQIEESNYKPSILIGIMRGAAPMIDVLSRIFKLKCAYLAVESYSGKGVEDEQGDIVFSREMSSIAPNMGGKILLCDEVFAALDVLTIHMLKEILVNLQNENPKICIVVCEHQARELLTIVDRAMVLSNSKIIAEGSPNKLIKDEKAKSQYFGDFFNN